MTKLRKRSQRGFGSELPRLRGEHSIAEPPRSVDDVKYGNHTDIFQCSVIDISLSVVPKRTSITWHGSCYG